MSIALNRVEPSYMIGHQDGYNVRDDPILQHDEVSLAGYQRGSITHAEEALQRRYIAIQADFDAEEAQEAAKARLYQKQRAIAAFWLTAAAIVFVVTKSLGLMLIMVGIGALHVWETKFESKLGGRPS